MSKRPSFADALQQQVGRRLQAVRRAKNFKQERLAAELELSRTTLSNIERGKQRLFVDQVYEAARVLGVGLDALLPPLHDLVEAPTVMVPADDPLPDTSPERLEIAVQTVMRRVDSRERRRRQQGLAGTDGSSSRRSSPARGNPSTG
jgi:transcriptional regulator with XRE-family HTH domain